MIDEGLIRGLIAVISLATFIGICWWAYRPGSRERFERDALLVFEEGELASGFEGRPAGPVAAQGEQRGISA